MTFKAIPFGISVLAVYSQNKIRWEERGKWKNKRVCSKQKDRNPQANLISSLNQQQLTSCKRKLPKKIAAQPTFSTRFSTPLSLSIEFPSHPKSGYFLNIEAQYRGYYNQHKMFHLDFYEDQENSLDILIKFRDEQQQPQSHTHEQCFLPLTEISVTSDHPPASPDLPLHALPEEDIITEQLIGKMQIASHRQEERMRQIMKRVEVPKSFSSSISLRRKRGESFQSLDQIVHSKRKIIHKKKSE